MDEGKKDKPELSKARMTRRELLKKSIKVAGYSVPVMFAVSIGSLDVWARNYRVRGKIDKIRKKHHHHHSS